MSRGHLKNIFAQNLKFLKFRAMNECTDRLGSPHPVHFCLLFKDPPALRSTLNILFE